MKTTNKPSQRQKTRRIIGILGVLLFPATFYYFSPYLSIMGAVGGVISGSVILFGLLFLSSFFLGRLFCSWACPAGALMDLVATGRTKPVNRKQLHWIKYLIWVPWVALLIFMLIRHRGSLIVNPGYATEAGVSVTSLPALIMYLMVILLFFILSVTLGRRAACHTICWMAPFMVLGRGVSTLMKLPALRLRVNAQSCTGCKACDRVCPMGITISSLVKKEKPDHVDCILCGECIDRCPTHSIKTRWSVPQEESRQGLEALDLES